MQAGMLSYPDGLNCWLLMYFHEPGVWVNGVAQTDPGWWLWRAQEAQQYGQPDAPWIHSWLHLWGTRAAAALGAAGLTPGRFFSARRGEVLVDTYFSRLFEERSLFHPPCMAVLGAQVEALIAEAGRALGDSGLSGGLLPEPVMRAKRFLDAHLHRTVSLSELARHSGISQPHLCALFKKAYNDPPGRYHLKVRMELAAFYLADRGLPVG